MTSVTFFVVMLQNFEINNLLSIVCFFVISMLPCAVR